MANRSDVRPGQRWSRKGAETPLSYRVVAPPEEGTPVQLSGPGPLRGIIEVDPDVLLQEWVPLEPSPEETYEALDRCMRLTMNQFDWLNSPSSATTDYFRSALARTEGSLPGWMSPSFWSVVEKTVAIPSTATVRAQSRGLSLIPACLVGLRVDIYPGPDFVKAVLPKEDLFVVDKNYLGAIIGLARILSAKLEKTDGEAT